MEDTRTARAWDNALKIHIAIMTLALGWFGLWVRGISSDVAEAKQSTAMTTQAVASLDRFYTERLDKVRTETLSSLDKGPPAWFVSQFNELRGEVTALRKDVQELTIETRAGKP